VNATMLHVDTCCNVSQFCQDPSQCVEEDDTVDNVVQSTSAGRQMFGEDTVLVTSLSPESPSLCEVC